MQQPVVIIGAGPIGLAAAANAVERGMDFVVLEAGSCAGAAVAPAQQSANGRTCACSRRGSS